METFGGMTPCKRFCWAHNVSTSATLATSKRLDMDPVETLTPSTHAATWKRYRRTRVEIFYSDKNVSTSPYVPTSKRFAEYSSKTFSRVRTCVPVKTFLRNIHPKYTLWMCKNVSTSRQISANVSRGVWCTKVNISQKRFHGYAHAYP